MLKTKLGISVGMMGAAIYFTGLFSGYIMIGLLVGYTLLFEDNEWLKKSAVKAFALLVGFSVLFTLVDFIPSGIRLIDYISKLFGGTGVFVPWINNLVNVVTSVLSILKSILFLVLGFKAFRQSTVRIGAIDNLINKYMG